MAKILAQDYFTNSALFDAEQVAGKPTNSATSSGVRYQLTCKECGAETQRIGNSPLLNTCGKCKVVWDRANNKVLGPGAEVIEAVAKPTAKPKAVPVVDTDSDEDTPHKIVPLRRRNAAVAAKEEEVAKPVVMPSRKKITVDSITDLLLKGDSDKPAPAKTKPAREDKEVHKFETILDYYDERLEDMWHRYYLVQWVGHDEPTFVLDSDFTDPKAVAAYEETLPDVERFKIMFPKTSRKNKTAKHAVRSKLDVLVDHGDVADKEVVETLPSPPPKVVATEVPKVTAMANDCIETTTATFKYTKLKVGQIIRIGNEFIEAVL